VAEHSPFPVVLITRNSHRIWREKWPVCSSFSLSGPMARLIPTTRSRGTVSGIAQTPTLAVVQRTSGKAVGKLLKGYRGNSHNPLFKWHARRDSNSQPPGSQGQPLVLIVIAFQPDNWPALFANFPPTPVADTRGHQFQHYVLAVPECLVYSPNAPSRASVSMSCLYCFQTF